jgi:hypothetical protein
MDGFFSCWRQIGASMRMLDVVILRATRDNVSAARIQFRPLFGMTSASSHIIDNWRSWPNGLDLNHVMEEGVVSKKQNMRAEQQDAASQKDPDEWVTGDESMTGPQASYLRTLAQEAGEPFDESLSKARRRKRSTRCRRRLVAERTTAA